MRSILGKAYQRVNLFGIAFVLAASNLSAIAPVLFPAQASAIGGAVYSSVGLNGWTTDRTAPSGGFTTTTFDGRNVLELGVVTPTGASSSFYQFEGVKKSITATKTIKADLFVDSTFPSNARIGIWGEGYDASNAISSYPIIEFNKSVSTNWRIFDSAGTGGWREVAVTSATTGWNTIELAINRIDSSKTDIYVNGVQVGASIGDPTENLKTIFLNNYNTGLGNYTVRWSNIESGLYKPSTPANTKFYRGTTEVATNSILTGFAGNNVEFKWDTTGESTDAYRTEVTYPDGTSTVWTNTKNVWIGQTLYQNNGFGQHGDGPYSYRVQSRSTTTGVWSDFSVAATLNYDSTAPDVAITSPTAGQAVSGQTLTIQGSATDAQAFNYYYCYVTLPGSSEVGTRSPACNTTWSPSTGGVLGTVDLMGLADGNYEAHLIAYDKAGNHSDANYSVAFKLDNTLPSTPVISTPTPEQFFKNTPITSTWSASTDANGINKYQVEYIYDDGHTFAGGPYREVSGSTTSRDHSPSLGEQGGVTIRVRSIDNAGNYSVWSNPVHYTYDATLPTVSISTVSMNHGIATINGIATDTNFKYYYCYVTNAGGEVGIRDGLCQTAWAAGTPFQSAFTPTVTGQPGGFIGSVDLTGLPTGTYTAYLVAHDKAGNIGQTVGFTFDADNTAPDLTVLGYTGTSLTPTITGTTSDATDVVTVDGVNAIVSPTVNGTGTYNWTYTLPTQTVGSRIVTVITTDIYGNQTTSTANVVIEAVPTIVPRSAATVTPNAFAFTPAQTTTPGEVLGDTTTEPSTDTSSTKTGEADVAGATDDQTDAGNLFGLAWYWYLAALAALGLLWWFIAAWRRRSEEE